VYVKIKIAMLLGLRCIPDGKGHLGGHPRYGFESRRLQYSRPSDACSAAGASRRGDAALCCDYCSLPINKVRADSVDNTVEENSGVFSLT